MNETAKLSTLWDVWENELPAKFKKTEVVESLSARWGITRENVYRQLKKNSLKNFVHDVSFLHTHYGIGFTMNTGFFFDIKQYENISQANDMANAKLFNLSNSY